MNLHQVGFYFVTPCAEEAVMEDVIDDVTLFTQQFKIQMLCVQCNLQQSGRVQQGTKCTSNCPV